MSQSRTAREELPRRIFERALGRAVVIHDDNSQPNMVDLRVGPADAPEIAIECTGAVDPVFTETWNIGPARGPLQLNVGGNWSVYITHSANIKSIKKHLGRILEHLGTQHERSVRADQPLKYSDPDLFRELDLLGIESISCYEWPGHGKAHLSMNGTGGFGGYTGEEIPEWLGVFLRALGTGLCQWARRSHHRVGRV